MSRRRSRMTFFFDAAACSGCKACQVACKDRHGLETGRLWRRVSEVTGGGWEDDGRAWRNTVFAYHLSISCNHCERPICLEGCPTRAITKRADGVVLIDPDRCMGCGYCSWVCPYGAPQYREDRGVMTKCSFCAEDLDSGLEPACVAACPVRALDAADRDELAERHGTNDRATGSAPLPDPMLTEPALLLAAHAHAGRSGEPDVELTPRPPRGLREWSLVLFTVLSQTAAGLAIFGGGFRWWLAGSGEARALDDVILPVVLLLLVAAILVSMLHLGRRLNALRAMRNLRSSWLSREALLALLLLGTTAVAWWPTAAAGAETVKAWAGWLSIPVAAAFLVGMARIYMQRTVPAWNHRGTPLAFIATAVLLGGLAANVVLWSAGGLGFEERRAASLLVLSVCAVGVGLPWTLLRLGRVSGGFSGGLSAAAGLGLLVLLLAEPAPILGATPTALSWVTLVLAVVDQVGRRHDHYARYERVGV